METKRYKLSEISLNVTDGEHGTIKDDNNGKYYLLSCKNIKNGLINITSNERIINEESFNKIQKRIRLEKNDVLITTVGTIGEMAIIETNDINYCFQRSVGIIKPNIEIVNPYYLYYSLKNETKQISTLIKGAVQKCLFINDMKMIEIDLPNMKIQNKIVKILNNIDKKIKLNNEINNNLHDIAQLELANDLEKDTTKFIMDELFYQITPGTNYQPDRVETGIPFLNVKNINNGYIDFKDSKYIAEEDYERVHKTWQPEENDLIISRIGTLGLVAVIRKEDLPLAVHYNFLDLKTNKIPFEFGYFLLKSDYFQTKYRFNVKNSVQEYVTVDDIRKIEVDIPDIKIMDKYKIYYNKILNVQRENRYLEQLRDTLLPKLMNDEIDLDNIEI